MVGSQRGQFLPGAHGNPVSILTVNDFHLLSTLKMLTSDSTGLAKMHQLPERGRSAHLRIC